MRKLTISLFVLLLFLPLWGQKYKDLDFLCVEGALNLDLDYSSAYILGARAEDFIALEPDWEASEKKMKQNFISAFNENSLKGNMPILIRSSPDNNYTLVLCLMEVKERGSHIEGFYEIVNKEGVCVFSEPFEDEAGMFGSTINLMEDAFKALGKALGKEFGSNTFLKSTKDLERQLSLAILQAIPITVSVNMSESAGRDYSRSVGKRRYDQSDLDAMRDNYVSSFNSNLSKKGDYPHIMTATYDASDWQLKIVIQKGSKTISCTTQLITNEGGEFYGQYNDITGKGDNPFIDAMSSLAKRMSNLKL